MTSGSKEATSPFSGSAQGEVLAIVVKVIAIDSTKEKPKKKITRGKCYMTTENMVCKAWVAASCDPKNGSKQSAKDFEDAVGEKYKEIKKEQEDCDAKQRAVQAMVALEWLQPPKFQKKISLDVMKWMGVLELTSDGEPKFKSGEDYEQWINRMHEIFQ